MQYPHIGTTEHINFPDIGIFDVPAKIDTGADGSSIWASGINLKNGILKFTLFAPGTVLYRDSIIETSNYKVTSVKNSFGDKEFRYKVKLKIQIEKIVLTRWFTLADRSRNTYPVLLGKNFLKNKFVVDVSQKNLISKGAQKHRAIIFTDKKEENEAFFTKVKQYNESSVMYEFAAYSDLAFYIDGNNSQVTNLQNHEDLANYSFTYLKDHHNHELAFSVAEYLNFKNRPFADREFYNSISASKLSEYMKLASHGISVPPSYCAQTSYLRLQYEKIKAMFGLPFVLKEFKSDKGKNNYLIHNKEDFLSILNNASRDNQTYIAQKYVPSNGFYRVYVLGKEAELAIWRSAVPRLERLKSHLNKPRGSANATIVPLSRIDGEVESLSVRAAHCLNRQVAGVDLVQDADTKKWYVLEANNDPQIRSGSFIDEKAKMVAKYIDKELNQ